MDPAFDKFVQGQDPTKRFALYPTKYEQLKIEYVYSKDAKKHTPYEKEFVERHSKAGKAYQEWIESKDEAERKILESLPSKERLAEMAREKKEREEEIKTAYEFWCDEYDEKFRDKAKQKKRKEEEAVELKNKDYRERNPQSAWYDWAMKKENLLMKREQDQREAERSHHKAYMSRQRTVAVNFDIPKFSGKVLKTRQRTLIL